MKSAHTGEGRYPGDHPDRLRACPWFPAYAGMSGFYVGYQLHPLILAEAGIQEIIPKPRQARPWFPAYAGMSGLDVCSQLNPLIPAKAGIQGFIPKPWQACPWTPACAGGSGGKGCGFN